MRTFLFTTILLMQINIAFSVENSDFNYIDGTNIKNKIENADTGIIFIPSGNYLIDEPIIIENKSFLTIKADERTQIISRDLYSDIIIFKNCSNVSLENLYISHYNPLDTYQCNGGEVSISNSDKINIFNCDLNGSGSVGVKIYNSKDVLIKNCYIHENTFTGLYISNSNNIKIYNNIIENNAQSIQISSTKGPLRLELDNNIIQNNGGYWGKNNKEGTEQPGLLPAIRGLNNY